MPNAPTNLGEFMVLVVLDAIKKVVNKAQGGFSPKCKSIGPNSNPSLLN
jgi:hypothetical protein